MNLLNLLLLAIQLSGTPAKVLYCSDGDTCRIEVQNGSSKIWMNVRLFGIDAPETAKRGQPGQPFGMEAREALNKRVQGKNVRVIQADLDPYNRPVVEIHLQEENLNLWMVEEGFAEVYRGRTKRLSRADYYEAESFAQRKKKGVWAQKNYVSPSEFRRQKNYLTP